MTDYQKTGRIDLAILDALSSCASVVNISVLHELVCASAEWVDLRTLSAQLLIQVQEGRVHRAAPDADSDLPLYSITCKGRAFLCAGDAKAIFGERIERSALPLSEAPEAEKPIQVTSCRHTEPQDREPATALLRVDEDELDAWWENLEVEAKADAWSQWSLSNDGRNCHIYIEPAAVSVPIVETAGESAEEWNALAERLNRSREEHIHIDETSGVFSAETREYLRTRFGQGRPRLRCSYCPSADIPLKAQYSDAGDLLAATCRNPECEAKFKAAFPCEPAVQQ